jgi:hypothetical protein
MLPGQPHERIPRALDERMHRRLALSHIATIMVYPRFASAL